MSRFTWMECDYDDDWALALGRYIARRRSVMKGKPKVKHLLQLKDALEKLTHKKLIEGKLCTEEGFCVLGAGIFRKFIDEDGLTPKEAYYKLRKLTRQGFKYGSDSYEDWERTFEIAKEELEMNKTLAHIISEVNDEGFWRSDPKDRYLFVLDWIEKRLKDPIGTTSDPGSDSWVY